MIESFLLLLIAALIFSLIVSLRAKKIERGENVPETGWLNRLAWRTHRYIEGEKAKTEAARNDGRVPDRTPEEVDAIRRAARRSRIEQTAQPNTEVVVNTVDGRLFAQFRRYREGEITLAEYERAIHAERDGVKEEIRKLREQKRFMKADDFEGMMAMLQEDLDDTRWRLDWIQEHEDEEER